MLGFRIEAKAGENGAGTRFGGMRINVCKPHLDFRNAVRIGGGFSFREEGGSFLVGLQHDFEQ